MALTAYEDGLCPGCGQPKDRAWDPDDAGYYDVQELVCAGCKASQQHDHGKAEPGTKTHLVYERPPESIAGTDHDPGDD